MLVFCSIYSRNNIYDISLFGSCLTLDLRPNKSNFYVHNLFVVMWCCLSENKLFQWVSILLIMTSKMNFTQKTSLDQCKLVPWIVKKWPQMVQFSSLNIWVSPEGQRPDQTRPACTKSSCHHIFVPLTYHLIVSTSLFTHPYH